MTVAALAVHAPHTRECTEQTFTSWDGTQLLYRAWPANVPTNKSLVLFHRGHEHSGRWQETVDALELEDYHIFAWDARGHGRSPGERGYAHSFSDVVRDADAFARHVMQQHEMPAEKMIALGLSVGAVAVAAWVHDYAPPIRAMILGTPAFRVKLYVPLAIPALRFRLKLSKKKAYVTSYVKAGMLTHDAEQAKAYVADPLISKSIAVNVLIDLFDAGTRLLADAGAITVPTLVLAAGKDWVVKNAAQKQFFGRLSSPRKEWALYPDCHHAIFHEKQRDAVVARVRKFIMDVDGDSRPRLNMLAADQAGYTRTEYDSLRRRLSPLAPRWWSFAGQRVFMKTLGRLSAGVRIGWRNGFDSGESLDYVYENRPRGITPLGKMIDAGYLNAIGWRGIRMRRENLEKLLMRAIGLVHGSGQPVRVLDIAGGPARYLLNVLQRNSAIDISALVRDRSASALDAGRALAQQMGIKNATFMEGDAFDPASLAAVTPRPNIAIVSGLYELFPDNGPARNSLAGLRRAIADGGYLIYTCQPWHPQVEMIARVLTNRDGKAWIMRRRTQEEMDALVRATGFEKVAMEIDNFGIFTVSLARRVAG